MKIYAMNDCDWVAAESLDEAIAFYKEWVNDDDECLEDPGEVIDSEMDRLIFTDEDYHTKRTFREELVLLEANPEVKFPLLFASTEY